MLRVEPSGMSCQPTPKVCAGRGAPDPRRCARGRLLPPSRVRLQSASLGLRPQPAHNGRPAFVPRTTGRRQEMTGTAGASNPQVRSQIQASPQVAMSAQRTLRHGFKSRWDYQETRRSGPLTHSALSRRSVLVPHLSRGRCERVVTSGLDPHTGSVPSWEDRSQAGGPRGHRHPAHR
jgi:hypothetical protein